LVCDLVIEQADHAESVLQSRFSASAVDVVSGVPLPENDLRAAYPLPALELAFSLFVAFDCLLERKFKAVNALLTAFRSSAEHKCSVSHSSRKQSLHDATACENF
jgi:predicted nucleic acid-binding Zn ribbon protein